MSGRCVLNSDEAIYGIMALDLMRGHWAPFFLGQDYLGAFQALASLIPIALLGANPLALRVTAILEGLAVLLLWKWIFRKWGLGRAWAFFAFLFAFAPDYITFFSLESHGTIELLTVGTLWTAAFTVVFFSRPGSKGGTWRWFLLGLATGFAWWTTQQVVYFLLPVGLWALIDQRFRGRLSVCPNNTSAAVPRRRTILAWALAAVYFATLGLIMLRGTVSYQSPLSGLLFRYRWVLVALHLSAAMAYACAVRVRIAVPWLLACGVGILLGYLPALAVFLAKPVLYNTFLLQSLSSFPANLSTFLAITGGSTIGLLKPDFHPMGVPWVLVTIVVAVYLTAVGLLVVSVVRRWATKHGTAPGEVLLALALVTGSLFFLFSQRFESEWPRYSFALIFFLLLILAWFLESMWRMNRWVAATIMLVILGVNVHSAIRHPATPVLLPSLEEPSHRELIDFVTSQGIHTAVSGFGDARVGYWFAYCLSFTSGESLVVHPAMHMPRVDRYRVAVEEAERIAIVTRFPEENEAVFRNNSIPFRQQSFGPLTVIWDFDKDRAAAAGLPGVKPPSPGAATAPPGE